MLRTLAWRPSSAIAAIGCVLVLAGLTAGPAAAATGSAITACVNRKSGVTRIVKPQAKCRKSEQKLSWNTVGPPGTPGARGKNGPAGANGKNGTNGTNGTNGVNGAVAGYSAIGSESELLVGAAVAVVSKVLPPGSYLVSAKTILIATAAAATYSEVLCALTDNPGTSFSSKNELLDLSLWEGALPERGAKEFRAGETVPALSKLTSSLTTTVALVCTNIEKTVPVAVTAHLSELTAVQMSKIE